MTPAEWDRAKEVLSEALERDPTEREAFLQEACANDTRLRRRVEALLSADREATEFLNTPVAALADGASAALAEILGSRIGPYQIVREIGCGSMGTVYLAERADGQFRKRVAIKVVYPGPGAEELVRRFRYERQALADLEQTNITRLLDSGTTEDGLAYMVLEYVEGPTLAERISLGALPLEEALAIAGQIAQALAAAHAKGIAHRDLKPANVKITPEGVVKVLDFGLAKFVRPSGESEPLPEMSLQGTEAGMILGTAFYMAPEQARGLAADQRADIWAFGVVLWEMLTGHRPFVGKTLADILSAVITTQPDLDAVPLGVRGLLAACLQKDPGKRLQNIADWRLLLLQSPPAARPWRAYRKPALLAATVLVLGATALGYLNRRRPPILTGQDSIVLADFRNTTGDPDFDLTLRQALALKLAESPFLNVLSDAQMRATVKRMMLKDDEPITPRIGREICERNGLKAVVTGSIAPVGHAYFLELEALNCAGGESLARTGGEVASKSKVLRTLGNAAVELRGKLGESLKSIQKFDRPFGETSSSLEALRAYAVSRRGDGEIFSLNRALQLDPNFAAAYAALSAVYANRKDADKAAWYAQKAFDLRDKVTEREKFLLTDKYYGSITGQLEERLWSNKMWTAEYPRDNQAFSLLGNAYSLAGQYEKALEATREALRLEPNGRIPYVNAMGYFAALNRFDEAKAVYQDARRRGISNEHLPIYYYGIAFTLHDTTGMEEAVREVQKNHYSEDQLLVEQGDAEASSGRLRKARELYQRAVELAERKNDTHSTAMWYARLALVEALFGQNLESRRNADQALKLAADRDLLVLAGWSFARARAADRAGKVKLDLLKAYPLHTIVNRVFVPALQADIEISANHPDRAIQALQSAAPYEMTSTGTCNMYAVYVRGEAYLQARQGEAAAAEFQRLIDHPGVILNSPIAPLARLGLARAYAAAGDIARSRAAYEELFAKSWNSADPDLPLLLTARKERDRLPLPR